MTIALSGTPGTNTTAGATSLSIPAPVGNASGVVLVASLIIAGGSGVTVTPVDAWTVIATTNSTTVIQQVLYVRVAGGSEPANYVFNFGGVSHAAAGGVMGFTGVDNVTPQDAAGSGQANASSFTNTCPSITTVTANAWVVNVFGANLSNSSSGYSAGLTEQYDVTSASNAIAGATSTLAVAGASGAATTSNLNKAVCIGQTMALRPATVVLSNIPVPLNGIRFNPLIRL